MVQLAVAGGGITTLDEHEAATFALVVPATTTALPAKPAAKDQASTLGYLNSVAARRK